MRVPTNVPRQQQPQLQAGVSQRQDFGSTMQEVRSETNVQAAEAEAMVKARCILARSNPRDIKLVRSKILEDCKRPVFADKAIYSKPVGDEDPIEGASVRLAEALARHMGNLDINATIASETFETRRIRVYAMDLETNMTTAADVVINKIIERKYPKDREVVGQRENSKGERVYQVIATEDELLNKTNAAVSKMRRNKILEVVPADITEEALAACNATLAAEDPEVTRKKLIAAFLELGVTAQDLVAYVGHPLDKLDQKELSQLRRMYNGIKDKESTWQAFVDAKANRTGQSSKAPAAPGKANGASPAAAAKPEEDDVDPPHNPKTGEVLEPSAEDVAAAAAREALRKADEQARATEAKPPAPATQTVQGQLGIDFGAADATDQVKAKMQAVVDDPAGTVEQLMKVARMAEHCPKERQQELGKFTVQCRSIINGRKKA